MKPAVAAVRESGMNKTEESYDTHLQAKLRAGEIAAYWFQGLTLKLADDCRFTGDFLVQMNDGTLEIHDTKACRNFKRKDGSLIRRGALVEEDAAIKMRVASKMFPFKIKAMYFDGAWKEQEF